MAAILLALALTSQVPTTLNEGLAGHWKLDEETGPLAADNSGNGRDGTWVGNVASAVPGNDAIQFPNPNCLACTGGHVTFPEDEAFNLTGNLAIAFWMYPTADVSDWHRMVGKGSYTGVRSYGVWQEPGNGHRLVFQCYSADGAPILDLFTNGGVPNNAWTHVACTIEDGVGTIYLNGQANATDTLTGPQAACSDPLTFGRPMNGSANGGNGFHTYYRGWLDDIRIYERSLTPAEAAGLAEGYGDERPDDPVNLAQFDPTVVPTAQVAPGGTLSKGTVEVRAKVTSHLGGELRLAVEVRAAMTPFTGTPVMTGTPVPSGQTASVSVANLVRGTAYHWQVKAIDSADRSSSWISFGTHPDNSAERDFETIIPDDPPTLSAIQQLDAISGNLIIGGGIMTDSETVRFQAGLNDLNDGQVRILVEVVPDNILFQDIPTAAGSLVAPGGLGSVDVTLAPGRYHWQACAANEWNTQSAWVGPGGMPDFVIKGIGSRGHTLCGQTAGLVPGVLALLLATLLPRRR